MLSGFLMGRILFVKKTPLTRFYQRRVSRIFPAAYMFVAVMVIVKILKSYEGGQLNVNLLPSMKGTAAACLFYMNYYMTFGGINDVGIPTTHFWSLCVEEHAYIVLSLLALLCRRTRVPATFALLVALCYCFGSLMVIGVREDWFVPRVLWRSDCHGGSIIVGAIAACLVSRVRDLSSSQLWKHGGTIGSLFLVLAVFLNLRMVHPALSYTVGSGCLAVAILFVSRQTGSSRFWSFRPLAWLGTVSYSLYLWQQPFYATKERIGVGLGLIGAVLAGLVSYYLLERPARSYLNSKWDGPARAGQRAETGARLDGPSSRSLDPRGESDKVACSL